MPTLERLTPINGSDLILIAAGQASLFRSRVAPVATLVAADDLVTAFAAKGSDQSLAVEVIEAVTPTSCALRSLRSLFVRWTS
jgi:hypothetical protein